MSGPTANPFGPGMADPLAGAAGVSATGRSARMRVSETPYPVQIVSIKPHNGQDSGAGPGTLVDVLDDGKDCGWRIQLGGKWPKYGIQDLKRLYAACEGLDESDPKVTAADAELRRMMMDPCPYEGRTILVAVSENLKPDKETGKVKIDKATGLPYLTVHPSAFAGAQPAPRPAAAPVTVAAPATPPALPAAPPVPPAAPQPPPGWFPIADPTHPYAKSHWYNATGFLPMVPA